MKSEKSLQTFCQVSMIAMFMYRSEAFPENNSFTLHIIGGLGIVIFLYCLFILYVRGKGLTTLITTGVFKYTRHPMYTGIICMDFIFWKKDNFSVSFWVSLGILYILLVSAAYLQERETLKRFGVAAINYYAKTPRLFIFYPFRKRKNAKTHRATR